MALGSSELRQATATFSVQANNIHFRLFRRVRQPFEQDKTLLLQLLTMDTGAQVYKAVKSQRSVAA